MKSPGPSPSVFAYCKLASSPGFLRREPGDEAKQSKTSLASFLSIQFLITCSMQKWRGPFYHVNNLDNMKEFAK